ncbi:unnamed protein product [Echinostoma caproni]|uniref:Copine domain-containing protein n=1 Tax=Echinostoma caproni TaxID=27848 RepID=A0A183B053_9TREM|nr:unnamed protein product [Echinostoma caproni]
MYGHSSDDRQVKCWIHLLLCGRFYSPSTSQSLLFFSIRERLFFIFSTHRRSEKNNNTGTIAKRMTIFPLPVKSVFNSSRNSFSPVSLQNGHIDNPYCEGIQGAMAAYAHSLRTVKFHGPTNFAPIINTVARYAEPGSQYSILLILTDGIISDLPQTRAAIVNASSLPLSIIIVGVGPANFDEMEELDGDEIRLTSRGRAAVRDIVQVSFSSCDLTGHCIFDDAIFDARKLYSETFRVPALKALQLGFEMVSFDYLGCRITI